MSLRTVLRLLGASCLLVFCFTHAAFAAKKYTLMAVFAHPDDEVSIGPLLAKYASEGHTVHLVIAGSGEQGVTPHSNIQAGDELGAARREEARCAARKLGIREPFLLALRQIGTPQTGATFAARLRELIDQVKPDVLVTFGPDGLTGHGHHIAVGNVVTRLFQQQALLGHRPRKLYYVAYPESRFPDTRPPFGAVASGRVTASETAPLGTVSDAFISTVVDGGRFLGQAREGMACHKTQFDEQGLRVWYERIAETLGGKVFLRLVLPSPRGRETDIFKGL